MSKWTRKSALIQPRTSLLEADARVAADVNLPEAGERPAHRRVAVLRRGLHPGHHGQLLQVRAHARDLTDTIEN